jgi:hypothetical protein
MRPQRFVDRYRAIARATLPATWKAVLWALLDFADAETGECWPSVETLAQTAGLKPRATRGLLRKLEEAKLVEYVKRSKGGVRPSGQGHPHRLKLTLEPLVTVRSKESNPAPDASFIPAPDTPEPGTGRPATRHAATPNPAPSADKPSMHPPREPRKEPPAVIASAVECVDAPSPTAATDASTGTRELLFELGVRGVNLDRLARCSALTPEVVRQEAHAVRNGGGRVRNFTAVLVTRLMTLSGEQWLRAHSISPELQTEVARLQEAVRRRRQRGISASTPDQLSFGTA